jgi:MYXO-CTERM domain-containing protein
MRRAIRFATMGAALLAARPSGAVVMQPAPDNTPLPQPSSAAEISLVESRGFSAAADTLAGLFQNFAGGADATIDPINDAATTPGTFPAQCGFRVQIVLKGGGCQSALGWYNATNPATKPSTIYSLVPGNLTPAPPNGIGCQDDDFCPLAIRTTSQAPQHSWADPLPSFTVDIASNPNWTGGAVGFALIGNPTGQCSETKYSQGELADQSASGAPWISALVYHSKADVGAYYLAFEDSPTCAASWRGCQLGGTQPLPAGSGNDGDFNDDVYYIAGLNCSLAGGSPDGGVSGAAGATGAGGAAGAAGGATTGPGGAGGATTPGTAGAGGTTGAGDANGSPVGGASGTAGNAGSAGAPGAAGASGAAGANGSAGAGGPYGNAGATGATGAAGRGTTFGVTGSDGTGCGCRIAGSVSSWWSWTLLLVALALALARRRRRAPAIRRDQ